MSERPDEEDCVRAREWVEAMIASDMQRIEASRRAIQDAAQEHEDLIISLAAQMIARRSSPDGGNADGE